MSKILQTIRAIDAHDGANVPLKRVFGHANTKDFDPFLMLDHFSLEQGVESEGFPWHPHAGIETITYLLSGEMIHEDTLGNRGVLKAGEIQWMSAGSGLFHQELPQATNEKLSGFQFWLNLPKKLKYKDPEYQYIEQGKMPIVEENNTTVRVISGSYKGTLGPIQKPELQTTVYHISLKEGATLTLNRTLNTTGFLFVYDGLGSLEEDLLKKYHVYLLDQGSLPIIANESLDAIFVEGLPLKEPIAWYGPVVMNTNDEVREVLRRLQEDFS